MTLIKVVQSVIDLRVFKVDIGSEFDFARRVICFSWLGSLRALVVVADVKIVKRVSLVIEQVTERREKDESEQHHRKATAPSRRDDLMTHHIVKHTLLVRQEICKKQHTLQLILRFEDRYLISRLYPYRRPWKISGKVKIFLVNLIG